MNGSGSAFISVLLIAATPFFGNCQPDSFSIYFQTGVTSLQPVQIAYIDSLLYSGVIPGKAAISIMGYADEPGSPGLNQSIAGARAASVKAYLLSSGMERSQIRYCRGVGNILPSGNDARQRRVDIVWGRSRADAAIAAGPAPAAAPARTPRKGLKALGGMKMNELLVLEDLLFKLSDVQILKESMPVLDELVQVMNDYPALKIRIEGHVCCGSKSKETDKLSLGYSLSLGRAGAVREYLVAKDIDSARIFHAGYGFSKPKVYPEITDADMVLNRRVEIRVIANK